MSVKKSTFSRAAERRFISEATHKWLFGVPLAIAAIVFASTVLARTENWPPDGILYAQRMLQDAGMPQRQAQLTVRAFYEHQPLARNSRCRNLLTDNPPAAFRELPAIFAARVVYPYACSLLYPRFGFGAMLIVSRAAFVLAVMALFVFLADIAPAWLAALGAAALGLVPEIRALSSSPLTDMPAIALWICVCAVMAAHCCRPSLKSLALFALLGTALAFTRPLVHMPMGAAAAIYVSAWLKSDARLRTAALGMLLIAGGVAIVYVLGSISLHSAGIPASVHWGYERWLERGNRAASYGAWYAGTIAVMVHAELANLVRSGRVLAWFFIILSVLSDFQRRVEPPPRVARWAGIVGLASIARWAAPLCLGAGVANFMSILLDPIPSDLSRVIEAPVMPLEIAGFVCGVIILAAHLKAMPGLRLG